MRGVSLLDVNVLLALFDPNHVHHDIAHDWFDGEGVPGWATCPLTENGFLRTANVARKTEFVQLPDLIDRLRTFQSSGGHQRWNDDVSLLDERLFQARTIRGRRQLTDIYLLGLAVKHGGRLATFDQRIPLAAVKAARAENLVVLAAAE